MNEDLEEKRQQLVMKSTKAYQDLLSQIMEHPVEVVILSRPVITKKRVSPAISSYAPGTAVYEICIDAVKGMTEEIEETTSVIESADGKRIIKDPKIKLSH